MMFDALLALCRDCAANVYGARAPSPEYAESVARLLFGTAIQESGGLRWARQIGFGPDRIDGGWSWWQLERGSVADSTRRLSRYPALASRAAAWLFETSSATPRWYDYQGPEGLMFLLWNWPRMACLFARLHYMRDARPVPEGLEEQAAYWKRVFNTRDGAGTPAQYVDMWRRHAAQTIGG